MRSDHLKNVYNSPNSNHRKDINDCISNNTDTIFNELHFKFTVNQLGLQPATIGLKPHKKNQELMEGLNVILNNSSDGIYTCPSEQKK